MNRFIQIVTALAVGLIPMLLPAPSSGSPTGEHVAVLYANDGTTLYIVDPNDGAFAEIGKLHWQDGSGPAGATAYGQMVFHDKLYKLFATANYQIVTPDGRDVFVQAVVEIDPHTAVVSAVTHPTSDAPPFFITYDPSSALLYIGNVETVTGPVSLATLDPATGHVGSFFRTGVTQYSFCSGLYFQYAHPWAYLSTDNLFGFHEYSAIASGANEIPGGFDGYFPSLGGDIPNPQILPHYWSFSFDPYTGVLFASAWPVRVSQDGSTENLDRQHTILCTVDLTTGKPHKVIATYEPGPPSPLYGSTPVSIAWGITP